MQVQSIKSKLGEVKYRSKIVKQQLGKTKLVKNEPVSREFKKMLKGKLKDTQKVISKLQKQGITISPYLEVGSEHALRPALLNSKFGARGFATDISLYSLAQASEFARQFGFIKAPQTICADANNLPFKSNSFPFVLIYETLHHFPDPKPVLTEIKRVLAPGGLCLIGSDPIEQSLQINLWYRPNKLRNWEKLLKYMLILPFISHIGKTEVEEGILEDAFSLKVWQNALSIFDKVEVKMRAFPLGPTESVEKTQKGNWLYPSLKTRIALYLFGGGLQAFCFKSGRVTTPPQNLKDSIICPDCLNNKNREISLKFGQNVTCPNCQNIYYKKKNVLVLLEKNLEKKILPAQWKSQQ